MELNIKLDGHSCKVTTTDGQEIHLVRAVTIKHAAFGGKARAVIELFVDEADIVADGVFHVTMVGGQKYRLVPIGGGMAHDP